MQKFDQSVTVNAVKVERTDIKVEPSFNMCGIW